MAWTEQCKVAFEFGVRAKKKKGMNLKTALRELSDESEIPYNTLRRWNFEKQQKSTNTDTLSANSGNNSENEDDSGTVEILCSECEETPPENNRAICGPCRHKKERCKKINYIHSLTGQIKTMANNIRKDGSTNPKWNNAVPKKEYKGFIDILIETINIWKELTNGTETKD